MSGGAVADLKMDGVVVTGYAETVESAAAELDSAVADLANDLPGEAFGSLAASVGVGESYGRASESLRRQLADGAEAMRSAAEALRLALSHHGSHDDEAAQLIKRVGGGAE